MLRLGYYGRTRIVSTTMISGLHFLCAALLDQGLINLGDDEHPFAWSVLLIRPHASGDETKVFYKHPTPRSILDETMAHSWKDMIMQEYITVREESFGLLSPESLRGAAGQHQFADSIVSETVSCISPLHAVRVIIPFLIRFRFFISNLCCSRFLFHIFFNRSDGKGGVSFEVIFGPAYKGISLGAVVCAALYNDHGVDVGFAYNRKEAKDHGEGGTLVGASMADGKRVLVIDDVITAGTAIRESYDMLKAIGAEMIGVAIALDRAEKRSLDDPVSAVQAVARDLAVPVVSIVSLPQLQIFLEKSQDYGSDVLTRVSEYRSQYGV